MGLEASEPKSRTGGQAGLEASEQKSTAPAPRDLPPYHEVQLDALCCSPEIWDKNSAPEWGWKIAGQSKLYHKIELDALCQNMLKTRPKGLVSPQI